MKLKMKMTDDDEMKLPDDDAMKLTHDEEMTLTMKLNDTDETKLKDDDAMTLKDTDDMKLKDDDEMKLQMKLKDTEAEMQAERQSYPWARMTTFWCITGVVTPVKPGRSRHTGIFRVSGG
jgi:hypothetical protein